MQGWKESGFNAKYGNEIREAYKGKIKGILDEAINLIYQNKSKSKIESIKSIVNKAKQIIPDTQKGEVENIWQEIQRQFPKQLNNGSDEFNEAINFLLEILDKGELKNLQVKLDTKNVFNKWYMELEKTLDELHSTLTKVEMGENNPQ